MTEVRKEEEFTEEEINVETGEVNEQADNTEAETASEETVTEDPAADLADEHLNRLKRLQADFDNYKRRTKIEKEEFAKYANETLVANLLPVLDNFDRALITGGDLDSFKEGIEMIAKQLTDVLSNQGLEAIDTNEAPFDPNFHQAVMKVEAETDEQDNRIVEEFQKGYMFKGKVIRPAMVKVASK